MRKEKYYFLANKRITDTTLFAIMDIPVTFIFMHIALKEIANATLQSVITIITTNIVVKIENEHNKIIKK